MTPDKTTIIFFMAAAMAVVFVAVAFFPRNITEFFGGSIFAFFWFRENGQYKLAKKEVKQNNE